jgi:Cft2 family RNA processing exonuclease
MLGSAQLLFEHDGASLLYTGDIKLRQTGGAPATVIPKADVLIIESTYGRPHFRFGDPDSIVEAIAMWCRRALDSHVTPVLLCHALGKTEEMMLALAPYGFRFALEKRCVPCAREYATAGRPLPEWVELDGQAESGRVVIAPPAGKDEVRRLGRYRTALVSGWAKDAEFARIFGADATFDLSDHCDFDELIDVVERSGADQVYTVHGYTADFARHLRKKGIRASALEATEQLALAL